MVIYGRLARVGLEIVVPGYWPAAGNVPPTSVLYKWLEEKLEAYVRTAGRGQEC